MKDSSECNKQLFARYGSRCRKVAEYQNKDDAPLKHYPEIARREVTFLAEKEKVVHLDDLILRRSLMAYLEHLNLLLIDELAEVLDWSDTQKKTEIERTLDILQDIHGVGI